MDDTRTIAVEWRDNWKAVLAAAIGLCFTILHFYTLGVFLAPLQEAYGWSKSAITAGPTIYAVIYFFIAAKAGDFANRVGVRKVALLGFCAYCLNLAAFGFAGPHIWTWYALWLVFALVFPFANTNIWSLFVAGRFNRSRGLALAVALCGTGVASSISPYLIALAIDRFGWSNAYHLLGLISLIVGLPLLYLLLPHSPKVPPEGSVTDGPTSDRLSGMGFGEAVRSRPFWILVFAAGILGFGIPTLMLHFVSIGQENGISAKEAAAAAGLIGISAILGRIAAGLMLDVLPGRIVAAVMFAAPAIACVILLNVDGSLLTLSIAACVIGICTGAEFDVLAVFVSRYMGMRNFASINGQVVSVFGLGVGLGPAISSVIVDQLGSYTSLLIGLAFAFLLPPVAVAFLGRPAFHHKSSESDVASADLLRPAKIPGR